MGWLAYQLGINPRNFFHRLQVDHSAVGRLFDAVDFIGVSAYAAIPADFQPAQLQNSAFEFADCMIDFGVDVKALVTQKGKQLHYSEFGIGGGLGYKYAASRAFNARLDVLALPCFCIRELLCKVRLRQCSCTAFQASRVYFFLRRPLTVTKAESKSASIVASSPRRANNLATSASEVARVPYLGVYGSYSRGTDPWQQWQHDGVYVETREFLRSFYKKATQFFGTSKSRAYTYPVSAVFVWNLVSPILIAVSSMECSTRARRAAFTPAQSPCRSFNINDTGTCRNVPSDANFRWPAARRPVGTSTPYTRNPPQPRALTATTSSARR